MIIFGFLEIVVSRSDLGISGRILRTLKGKTFALPLAEKS
jgi:hypothetical protein